MRIAAVVVWMVCAACGRIGFDALDDRGEVSGDGPAPRACLLLPDTCGPLGTSSCCASPIVSGGTFFRGYDVAADTAFKDMTHSATISDFRLDTYEVTVGRFRQFVEAGLGTQQDPPPAGAGARRLNGLDNQAGWDPAWNTSLVADTAMLRDSLQTPPACFTHQSWTDTPGANESLPINCVTWLEANAFCAWDGGFVPTEAEWNYAAAGGAEHRAYPWANPPGALTLDCSYANAGSCNADVIRVGTKSPLGDGRWGQADLGGNVFEWTLDWYGAYADPCDDCANIASGPLHKVIHGGDATDLPGHLRPGDRDYDTHPVTERYYGTGFRCARPL